MIKRVVSGLLPIFLLFSVFYVGPAFSVQAELYNPEGGNLGFGSNFDGWNVTGDVTIQATGGKSGKHALMKSGSSLSKTITGIPQGSYTVSMSVKGATSSNSASLTIKDTGGPDSVLKVDSFLDSSSWRELAHRNVLVYNGQMTININAGTSSGLHVDEITITLDSNDNNPVQNWDFEAGLENWETVEEVLLDSVNADTGSNAVKLGDQSEISQTIPVQPNTDYIATVRMKVDVQDTYKSTKQYHLNGTDVMGVFVERLTLGNRVNLGVRGVDGVVLRQAPASTEGYALVTIAFRTEEHQTEVELYANTIYDQNYVDSVTVYENVDEDHPYPNGWQRGNYEETDNTHPADNWTSNGDNFAYVDNFNVFAISNDYIKGVDMSFLQPIEDVGGKYFANGVQQDALRILSNHGVNSILTGIWVKAGNPIYDWNTLTPLTTSTVGYDGEAVTGRQVLTGYFDKKHSVAIGKRATALNMSYTPSFHYSDTWISAAKAHMPYEWIEQDYEGKLSNPDINMLQTAVYNYVYDTLAEMKAEGVNVISVKNGNEQDGGLLFPVASGSQYTQHAAIITASARAAKEIYPHAINTIHSNTGYDPAQIISFFQAYVNRGAEIDGMAFSLYGGRETTGQFVMMNAAMQNNATKYFDYVNVETGFSFTRESPIADSESTMALTKYYSPSPNGQYNFLLDYIQAPLDLPNPHGVKRGFYYWNSESIPVYGAGHKAGEVVGGSKRILFNNGTESIKEMGSSHVGKAGDMMDSMYAFLHRGYTKKATNSVYSPLHYSTTNYDVTEASSITFADSNLSLKVGEVKRLQPTIQPMNQLISDYSISYSSNAPTIAEVSQHGFVVAKAAGIALITATIGSVSTTVAVTVNAADVASGMEISYEVIRGKSSVVTGTITDGNTINVKPYDKLKLKTTLAGAPTKKSVIYTVSDPETAGWYGDTWQTDDTVMRTLADKLSTANYDSVVQLNPVKGGTVQVTATSVDGAATLSFNVAITQTDVTAVEINEGDSIVRAGRTLQLTSTVTPSDASFYKVNWSSSDEAIATVDENGLVTAISPGTTTITVSSDAYPDITDYITLTVTEVLVEQILLSQSKLGLLVGNSKALTYIAVPDHAVNKAVSWSVKPGDEGIVSIDADGTVTALQAGTATVIVSANDGSNVSTEATIIVVDEPISAMGMELSTDEVWVQSNYFSPDAASQGESKPVIKLDAIFTPEETINTDIVWSSNNEDVATVNNNGVVTAHKSGVAVITATASDGGFTDQVTIYVPSISEDWENYDVGSKGGFTDGNTFTYEVVDVGGDHRLQAAVKSQKGGENPYTINRRTFTPVGGEEVVVEFDWNVGSFTPDNRSRGAHLSIEDANGNTYLALATFPSIGNSDYEMTYYILNGSTAFPTKNGSVNGNFNYIHGGGGAGGTFTDTKKVSEGLLKGNNKEYNVRIVLNFKNRSIQFTVTDKSDPSITATVSDLVMDSRVSYTNSFGAIAFSHYFNSNASWATSIDHLNVYQTVLQAEKIEYSVDAINQNQSEGIKLVPVTGALSATAKINANVMPVAADQRIAFTPLDELAEVIDVDANGVITVKPTAVVNYGEHDTIQSMTGYIRVSSIGTPEVYSDVKLTLGPPNASEIIQVYVDGEEYLEAIALAADETVNLSYAASGGDGTSDVYAYNWEVTSGNAVIDDNGNLSAITSGNVQVTFTIDFFRKQEIRTLEFNFVNRVEEPILLSQGKLVTASRSSAQYPAANAVDGSTSTTWSTGGHHPNTTLTVDLGERALIHHTIVAGWTPQDYKIEVSEDGTNFTVIAESNDIVSTSNSNSGLTTTDTMSEEVYGRYVRLTITNIRSAQWLGVREFEVYGNYAAAASEPEDETAPSWEAESQLAASNVGENSLMLTWTVATDVTEVVGYRVYNGTELLTEVAGNVTSYEVTGLTANTSYTFKVEAGDTANNWSTDGPQVTVTTLDEGEPEPILVEAITVIGPLAITSKAGTAQYAAEVTPADVDNDEVEWSVENGTGEATISATGLLTAVADGTIIVRATAKDGSVVKGELTVTISGQTELEPEPITVESLVVTPDEVELEAEETEMLTVIANFSDETTDEVTQAASYSSSVEAVATVSAEGVITAVGEGTATITVSYGGQTVNVAVTVTAEVELEPEPTEDTEAPTWGEGSNVTASNVAISSVKLTWRGAEDNVAVTGYKVMWKAGANDQAMEIDGVTTSATISGLQSYTSYTFTVEAVDAAGNWSQNGPSVTVRTNKIYVPADPTPSTEPEQSKEPEQPVEPEQPSEPEQSGNEEQSVQPEKVEFTDVPATHWASSAILRAAEQGIVRGSPDHTFKPNAATTRAEFMTMLANAFKWQSSEQRELEFNDSDSIGAWAKDAVSQGIERVIVTGYTDGSFRPNQEITRAEMVVMLVRALGIETQDVETTEFADDDSIPSWAKPAVQALRELGLLSGRSGNHFAANEPATRAEALVILLRVLES